jgi:hypothetical protein
MDKKCIICVLQKEETRRGVEKYIEIMENFQKINVSNNNDPKTMEFQRNFNSFYKLRRGEQFRNAYYLFLENNKKRNPSFIDVLNELYNFGNLEASFASKLLATIDPKLPIWDKLVLKHFNLKPPSRILHREDRERQANDVYERLKNKYKDLIDKDEGQKMIELFDHYFPKMKEKIKPIKKIDFIIWQSR